jgi:hypothetical protein
METYDIVHANRGWAIKHNSAERKGITRPGRVLWKPFTWRPQMTSERGLAITIKVDPPAPGEAAMGAPAT